MKRSVLTLIVVFLLVPPLLAKSRAVNSVAVDFPFDGGGMVTVSRMWPINKYIQIGGMVGGGVIEREIDVDVPGHTNIELETKALVLPFVGPRVSFFYHFVGLSVGFGAFYAKTDVDVNGLSSGPASGDESAFGTGFYSPLLAIDFYDKKRDLVIGLGLGGFLGTSYPDLEATNLNVRVISEDSPIDTLTLHVRLAWATPRKKSASRDLDEDIEF